MSIIKTISLLTLVMIFLAAPQTTQATFSIVAVDTATGEIGGAGGGCGYGTVIIHDIIEGIGVIHTQAFWDPTNQEYARNLMLDGLTPDSILTLLYNNDVNSNPYIRQYLIATVADPGNSAAYTGHLTPDHHHQKIGPGYAIGGNQLLSEDIVNDMETAFLSTNGELADKLMAAIQAANVTGADSDCLPDDKPAKSAFLRIVKAGDGGTPYIYVNVHAAYGTVNPIDSLQILFDLWKAAKYVDPDVSTIGLSDEYLDLNCPESSLITITPVNYAGNPPGNGIDSVIITSNGNATISNVIDNGDGAYEALIHNPTSVSVDTLKISAYGENYITELSDKPIIGYYSNGDTNGNGAVNILDITYLIAFLYSDGPPPNPIEAGDVNGNGAVNILDATYLIAYLYSDGEAPVCV